MASHVLIPFAALALPVVIIALLMSPFILLILMRGRHGPKGNDEELRRFVQEFHRDLERMEKRVESLETLLLQSGGHEDKSI